jgi:hypothetical protein
MEIRPTLFENMHSEHLAVHILHPTVQGGALALYTALHTEHTLGAPLHSTD